MRLSTINELPTSRDMIEAFGGYNHNLRIDGSEFYDMKNLTSSHYPLLSPRGKRGVYEYPEGSGDNHSPNGLIAKDALCYVDRNTLYINNKPVDGLILADSPKQLVSMGAYIVIFPDKVWVNTLDLTDYGNIESTFNSDENDISVTYEICKLDGSQQDITYTSPAEPEPEGEDEELPNNCTWLDTSSVPHTLKVYSASSKVWTSVATTYVKISAPNIAASFKKYDAVTISGIHPDITQLKDLEGQTITLWDAHHDEGNKEDGRAEGTADYIVVVGMLDAVTTKTSQLKLERKMPILDFVIESNNRLWGCRYGEDINGNIVNEIYASALGDFKNWNSFMSLSTDSYSASVGTDGPWTGAITHLGYPIFFKENYMHKVYGNYPANYQIQSTACRGVQKGAGNSLAIVNERLFYKARSGVCVYDGSLPSEISYAFGNDKYTKVDSNNEDVLRNGAVAGSHHNKYYISMCSDIDGQWYLFVYDTSNGMWHKEDNTRVDAFCSCNSELYYIDHNEKEIKTIFGSGKMEEKPVSWMAESGIIGTTMPDKKYISRLSVRMSLDVGTKLYFYIQYDSMGDWEYVSTMESSTLRTFTVPIKTKRCDHFRLRIVGEGDAKIFSITKTIEQGSDV